MRIRILCLGLVWAATLCGQYNRGHRFSWQEACYKNPGAPFCAGHDFAIKKTPPGKDGTHSGGIADPGPFSSTPETLTPSVIVAGGIDWRFADPLADALIGFNFSKLAGSPVARALIAQLEANQGLAEGEPQKIAGALSGMDNVAISVHENQIVMMVTGSRTDSTLPALEPGWKAVPVAGNGMLIGHADAVDEARQRMASETTESSAGPLAGFAEARQANSEFWAVGSAALAGPQAVSAGAKRFSLTVSIGDRLSSDLAFEFNGAPDAKALQMGAPAMDAAAVEGNVVHVRMSMEAEEVQLAFGQITASPLGQRLAALVKAARCLPIHDATAKPRTKPMIYGLDDGPKEVKQYPER